MKDYQCAVSVSWIGPRTASGLSWRLEKNPLAQVTCRYSFLLASWGVGNNKPAPRDQDHCALCPPSPHHICVRAHTQPLAIFRGASTRIIIP